MAANPLPDYFELLRQMTGGQAASAAMPSAATLFDPVEIDKKIGELNIVHLWLSAQTNAVALSIKALEYQRETIGAMQAAAAAGANASTNSGAIDLAQAAKLFDPALWMQQAIAGLQAATKPAPDAPPAADRAASASAPARAPASAKSARSKKK